jgi:hypothetical protein
MTCGQSPVLLPIDADVVPFKTSAFIRVYPRFPLWILRPLNAHSEAPPTPLLAQILPLADNQRLICRHYTGAV